MAEPRNKELRNITQQLLETFYCLATFLDFLRENLTGKASVWWIEIIKDAFSTAGQPAVVIIKRKKLQNQ